MIPRNRDARPSFWDCHGVGGLKMGTKLLVVTSLEPPRRSQIFFAKKCFSYLQPLLLIGLRQFIGTDRTIVFVAPGTGTVCTVSSSVLID